MAYAALVSLRQLLLPLLEQDHYISNLINCLHVRVILLQEFFEEFPDETNNLEDRIRDKVIEAEYIIEYILCEGNHILHPTREFEKLTKVIEYIESIVEEMMKIKSSHCDSSPATSSATQLSDSSTPTSSSPLLVPTQKNVMVGFDSDLLAIKERLCGESSALEVIPICGMGGIGKTTLARNAFEDQLSIERFEIRVWVTVSQDYNLEMVLFTLSNSIQKGLNEVYKYETREEQVYKNLKGRKYLIVMDDVWSMEVWFDVRRLFPDDNNGSRIILTARILDVASYVASSTLVHEMQLMDEIQSWELLKHKVFKQENCPNELERIGRFIARTCKGLPLSIVVIAGLLSTVSQTQSAWEKIAENVNLAVTANSEQFTKLLSLSYTHLPHHLRACFLYMGAFPEDYTIRVSKLIKLWVAEGFVKSSETNTFEETAEGYLEDIVKRSLVLVIKRKSNGKIKSCSLHDVIRELCIRKAREEKFLVGDRYVKETPNFGTLKEILLGPWPSWITYSNLYAPGIRTVLLFNPRTRSLDYLKSFKLLRVLDVVELLFIGFPDDVFELIHLRYLAFTCEYKFDIPATILCLQNLQTLFIFPISKHIPVDWVSGFCMPIEIWRMPQIHHLLFSRIDNLPDPCVGSPSSALRNLQTLATVRNFKCTDTMVHMIPNLKKLGIIYDVNRLNWGAYHLDNVVHLNQLEKLKIHVEKRYREYPYWGNANLVFPEMLKKLHLRGCSFRAADMAMIGSLSNLEVLKLVDCFFEKRKWETNEGEFARLKFLQIIDTNLQHWVTESHHFPILQRLRLGLCFDLDEVPCVFGEIPTLELIEVDEFLVESAKQIQDEQEGYGNDYLQVRIAPAHTSLLSRLTIRRWSEILMKRRAALVEKKRSCIDRE